MIPYSNHARAARIREMGIAFGRRVVLFGIDSSNIFAVIFRFATAQLLRPRFIRAQRRGETHGYCQR
jgi:hypothetical protein